jgi:hypothetical protein
VLTLTRANRIIEAILVRGAELKCRPLSIIVVEPGCKVKAFPRMRTHAQYSHLRIASVPRLRISMYRLYAKSRPRRRPVTSRTIPSACRFESAFITVG